MARRRRSRLFCFNCDRSSPKDYYSPPWPRALPPRRIMADGKTHEINICPTIRKFQIEPCLAARVDKKIDCHLLPKHLVSSIGDVKMEYREGTITDSSGRVYECIGAIRATWRIEGYDISELDYFTVVLGDFPDGVDVLLEESSNVRNSPGLNDKPNSPVMLPFFTSKDGTSRKADKEARKKTEKRQDREEKQQEEELLRQQEQARQANNSASRNPPLKPSRGRR